MDVIPKGVKANGRNVAVSDWPSVWGAFRRESIREGDRSVTDVRQRPGVAWR